MTVPRLRARVPLFMWKSSLSAALAAVFLSACNLPPVPPSGVRGDRVTASDESDASRRARVRMELAAGYYGRGQYTTALDEVKLALQAQPELPDAYNLRGLIYSALGDSATAEDSFRHALSLKPQDGDSLHNLGWFLCQQRRYPEAASLFAKALEQPQYTGASRTLLARGVCEARAGQLPEAQASLQRAHDTDPSNPTVALNLSEVLYQRGDFERARFYVRRVNAIPQQTSAQSLWLAAKIERKLNNMTAANELGYQLRSRFPQSRESSAFDRGAFDE